jgi:hypothetical protein
MNRDVTQSRSGIRDGHLQRWRIAQGFEFAIERNDRCFAFDPAAGNAKGGQ